MQPASNYSDRIPSCPICFEDYEEIKHVPKSEPKCGQTICAVCIKNLKDCPLCRSPLETPLRNNVALLDLINSIKNTITDTAAKSVEIAVPALVPKKMLSERVQIFLVLAYPKSKEYRTYTYTMDLSQSCTELIKKVTKDLEVDADLFSLHLHGRALSLYTEGNLWDFGVRKEDTFTIHFTERFVKAWIKALDNAH